MAIEFSCEKCQRRITIEDEMIGMKLRCPGCQEILSVPKPVPSEPPPLPAEPIAAEEVRKCPFCYEVIQPQARKCRHCHEFLDRDLAIAKAKEEEEHIKRRIALEEQESRLAKMSLICAVVGLSCPVTIAGSIAGVLMSIAAFRQIQENPRLKGRAMARMGLILGVLGLLMWPAALFYYTIVAARAAPP